MMVLTILCATFVAVVWTACGVFLVLFKWVSDEKKPIRDARQRLELMRLNDQMEQVEKKRTERALS